MSAAIRRFSSRRELLVQEQAVELRRALEAFAAAFEGSPAQHRALGQMLEAGGRVLDSGTAFYGEGSFVVLTPIQNRLVVDHLTRWSKWPKAAPRLWAYLFEFLDPAGSGEILITREGLIERVGVRPRAVDGILRELVELQALIKHREPEPGKQGRGTVRYFMNPRVGSLNLDRGERAQRARAAPRLIVGGAAPSNERRARAASAPLAVL